MKLLQSPRLLMCSDIHQVPHYLPAMLLPSVPQRSMS